MSERLTIKGFQLGSTSIGKLLYGKKKEVQKPKKAKVINNAIADNFSNTTPNKIAEKEKPKKEIVKKYWYENNWKESIRIIGGKEYLLKSSYENNFALYLEMLKIQGHIKKWEYEPDKFYFSKVKRGLKAYIPDFKITNNNGSIEYKEVKGYMDSKAKTKLKRFAKYYPHLKLTVIDKTWFDAFKKKRIELKGWEK